MELILGGFAQGKLDFALSRCPDACVFEDGNYRELFSADDSCGSTSRQIVWNKFHLAVKKEIEAGKSDEEITRFVSAVVARQKKIVIISDEIGCGIVPMSADERRYRELVGRLQCFLAGKADAVYRVVCGVPQRIK